MRVTRRKLTFLLAGLATVVVVVGIGLTWKRIYYAIYPEARFWGRWSFVRQGEEPATQLELELELTFHRDGTASSSSTAINLGHVDVSGAIESPDAFFALTRETSFRVAGDRLVFENLRDLSEAASFTIAEGERTMVVDLVGPQSATATYRFEGDDRLRLEFARGEFLGDSVWVLRRLPGHSAE